MKAVRKAITGGTPHSQYGVGMPYNRRLGMLRSRSFNDTESYYNGYRYISKYVVSGGHYFGHGEE